jgi:hypothetical protein
MWKRLLINREKYIRECSRRLLLPDLWHSFQTCLPVHFQIQKISYSISSSTSISLLTYHQHAALLLVVVSSQKVQALKLKHYSKSEFNAASDSIIHLVPSHPTRDKILIQIHHPQDIRFFDKSLSSSAAFLRVCSIKPTGPGIKTETLF